MAFQTPGNTPPNIRHRIQDIAIQPTTSERLTKLEVLVDGRSVHRLSTIKPNQALRWDMQTYPCDVHAGSTIGLRFIEKHQLSPDREVLVEYTFSDTINQTTITKHPGAFPSGLSALKLSSKRPNTASTAKPLTVTVNLLDLSQVASNYSAALLRATNMVEETNGPLDRLGNSREVLKTILGFGAVVAELHPTAKLVIGLCTKAWEYLEKLQKQHEDLQRLIDGLAQMQPFIDSIKHRTKEAALEHVIHSLLLLIEDTCNFIVNSMHQTSAGRVVYGFSDTKESYRINELLQKFGDLKEQFDRGVGVQVLNQVLSSEQRALVNRLEPTTASLKFMPTPCHEGTRVQVIADICAWYNDTNNPQKLLWLYGQAGMGKSSIAASICQVLHDAGTLGAHFFFRRDDPHLRSPEHMLNVIVHRLAFQFEPYGRAVASAIEGYSGLLEMPLGQRYVHLVERPLQSLDSSAITQSGTFAIVVDALDECENTNSRRPLFTFLREMSQLVPWIKIVITSRPDEDIRTTFDSNNYGYVNSRGITSYDASPDVLKYTRNRMAGIANGKKHFQWPEDSVQELCTRAAGLFIWVETACKFIERGVDPRRRLEQVLTGTQSAEGSAPLDLLYATAIKQSMGDEGPDNVYIFRECIGAIVATGVRTPLSVASLESLLSSHISSGLLHMVVSGLGSVLYEDASQGGAVRVYHPSFADFILDPARSGIFYADSHKQNTVLAECSLRTMMRELRFNICGLETSHILNRDVIGLKNRLENTIGPHLAYSCLHWSSHLADTLNHTLRDQLGEFLYGRQLLYWIEAMSLLGQTSAALSSLLVFVDWAADTMNDCSSYAHDAYRFILTFYDAISQSTPHLYISALAFAPASSKLAQRMRPLFPNTFTCAPSQNQEWSTWLQSISHNGWVVSVACSANGRRIVSGCADGTVQIWDPETGTALSDPLNSPDVRYVAISSNGQRVASASWSSGLRVWDTETGASLGDPFMHDDEGSSLVSFTLSCDGNKMFCTNDKGTMLAWDINTRVQLSKLLLDHSDRVVFATVSPDEQLVASCSNDGTVKIWDVKTGTQLTEPLLGHTRSVWCISFSPNSRIIATGSEDTTVRIWEVSTGMALLRPMTGHSESLMSVTFSPDGRYVVSGSIDWTVRVWEVETGTQACSPLLGHAGSVYSAVFCANSRRVVSASRDRTVLIWHVGADVATIKSQAGHTENVSSVTFSSDGRYVASGSDDGTIRVWDARNGDEAFVPLSSYSRFVSCVAFIPNSLRVVSLGRRTVHIQDAGTGALVAILDLGKSQVQTIAISPNGQRIASGSVDGQVGLWDAETGSAVFTPVAAHSQWVEDVVFSPDGRLIASGSGHGTVRVWGADTGAAVGGPVRSHSRCVSSVCFSPNSRRIAIGYDNGNFQVWDRETSYALFESLQGYTNGRRCLAFTPDSRHVISCLNGEKLWICDAETGATLAEPLEGHLGPLRSIALSPDGRYIATGSQDSTVRIWDIENLRTHDQPTIDELFTAPLKRSVSTSILAHYANKAGWVTSSTGALLLWLPKQRQRTDDSLIQISIAPTPNHILLDFSRFVHGGSWVLVTGG